MTIERVGAVVIGRNEGRRLLRCLRSVLLEIDLVVYVDSGSSDGSPGLARGLGVDVVELDLAHPFTAARARNAGFARLLELIPDLELVQFLDGDCELQPDWLETGVRFLRSHHDVTVACGRRRERFPDASPWNRLTDLEWDTPIGETDSCGGDALIRVESLRRVGGYRSELIAGEEPELCRRLSADGGRIMRLDAEMTLHDAALHRFSQWYRRQVRAGHAYAEVAWLHRQSGYRLRELASIVFWGGVLPMASVGAAAATAGGGLLAFGAYGVLWWRIRRHDLRRPLWSPRDASLYAAGCVLGKLPQLQGVAVFAWNRWGRGSKTDLIEYKDESTSLP